MPKPLVLVVTVALMDEDDRVLMAQRPTGKHMAGYWEFPGGKIEIGENPENALIREIKEELSVTIAAKDLFPISFVSYEYDDFHLLMPLYGTREWEGRITPQEGQNTAWVHKKAVKDLQIVPADRALLPILERL